MTPRNLFRLIVALGAWWALAGGTACAQDDDSDPFSDSETHLPPKPGKSTRPVSLTINGEMQPVEDGREVTFSTESHLTIAVRNLYPNSIVSMQVQKAGIKGKTHVLQANEKGELDLEADTGTTRIAGTALLEYVDGMGRARNVSMRIRIQ